MRNTKALALIGLALVLSLAAALYAARWLGQRAKTASTPVVTAAVDIDIWRYEVRYGAVGTPWSGTTLLDRVDSLRLQSDQIPTGTWTLHVKALDSVGQYSTAAATVNVTVTTDSSAFLVNSYDQTAPTLTNMAEYALARTDPNRYFVSEDGVTAATKFPSTASSYGNVAATYHSSMTSTDRKSTRLNSSH